MTLDDTLKESTKNPGCFEQLKYVNDKVYGFFVSASTAVPNSFV